ncbi:MAG: PIN domain-containing protein [Streptococcaceae bacterium]|nr:PIN domain-containing protein [Streptococcaceae bacterium]
MTNNILVDTNIWLDIILKREGFYEKSLNSIETLISRGFNIFLTATTITDIYYIAKRQLKDEQFVKNTIRDLIKSFQIIPVDKERLTQALFLAVEDFEDSIQVSAGFSMRCEYILTRNVKDFENTLLIPITPMQLLEKM